MNILSTVLITGGGTNGALHELLYLVIFGVVLGLVYYIVQIAPFIPAVFKQILLWLIIGFGVIVLINFLLSLIGHPIFVL